MICRITRARLAPIASRTAISRARAVPRAISRLATLAHTINSTTATATRNTRNAGRIGSTSSSLTGDNANRGMVSGGRVSGRGGRRALPIALASSCAAASDTPSRSRASNGPRWRSREHRRRQAACRNRTSAPKVSYAVRQDADDGQQAAGLAGCRAEIARTAADVAAQLDDRSHRVRFDLEIGAATRRG